LREGDQLSYRLPKPLPNGGQVLHLTSLELLEKLSKLIPPPRQHRHRYFGVLAPNSPLRQAVTAQAGAVGVSVDFGPIPMSAFENANRTC